MLYVLFFPVMPAASRLPCQRYPHAINTCVLSTVSPTLYWFGESSLELGCNVCIHVLVEIEKRRGKIGFSSANELVHVSWASLPIFPIRVTARSELWMG